LRLSKELQREVEKYAKRHGYKSVQELTKETLREKILQEQGEKETREIMKNKPCWKAYKRSSKM